MYNSHIANDRLQAKNAKHYAHFASVNLSFVQAVNLNIFLLPRIQLAWLGF